MKYVDFEIEAFEVKIEKAADKTWWRSFKVCVRKSPVGGMTLDQALPIRCNEKDLQRRLRELEQRELDRDGLLDFGRFLGVLLLPPAQNDGEIGVRELFVRSLDQIGRDNANLRVRLRLPSELAAIPWEYMYLDRVGSADSMAGFLALDPRLAIVRHEELPISAPPPRASGDIGVLAALASPIHLDPLDLDREERGLQQALAKVPGVQLKVLKDPTLDDVQTALPSAQIFHFAGHGVFQQEPGNAPGTVTGTGSLTFDDGMVDAEKFCIHLRGNHVQLVVLGGCETGRRAGTYVWGGIAPALVRYEVPAVVANQYSIRDDCAIAFSRQFYSALAGGLPIERAVSAGRIAAYSADQNGRDWGVPVLYFRAGDGALFEGVVDKEVRKTLRTSAEANVNVRVKEVAAGGFLSGAKVREFLSGKLHVEVTVAGTVYGRVVGLELDSYGGGSANMEMDIGVVGPGGEAIGATIDTLGDPTPTRSPHPTKPKPRPKRMAPLKRGGAHQNASGAGAPSGRVTSATSLLPELMQVIDNLHSLMRVIVDPQQLETVQKQGFVLMEAASSLIGTSYNNTPIYHRPAAEALQQASRMIREAIHEDAAVMEAILQTAKAAELVRKMVDFERGNEELSFESLQNAPPEGGGGGGGGGGEGEPDRTSVLTRAKPPTPFPWSSPAERGPTHQTRRKASESSSTTSNVKVGRVTGGRVIGTQVNKRDGDRIHGNQMNFTIFQGPTGVQPSANTTHTVDEPSIEEKIRLDVALPKSAVMDEPFDVVIAVKQPDAPALVVADLDQVVSSQGSVFRSEENDVVKYRVEVTGAGFEVMPKWYVIELRPKTNSQPVAFQVVSSKKGKRSLIVNAYQEDEALAAQTRVTIEVAVAVSTG